MRCQRGQRFPDTNGWAQEQEVKDQMGCFSLLWGIVCSWTQMCSPAFTGSIVSGSMSSSLLLMIFCTSYGCFPSCPAQAGQTHIPLNPWLGTAVNYPSMTAMFGFNPSDLGSAFCGGECLAALCFGGVQWHVEAARLQLNPAHRAPLACLWLVALMLH